MSKVPYEYLCPISLHILLDPYTAEDNFNYEYDEIIHWQEINNTSPMTGELIGYNLFKNHKLKEEICEYLLVNQHFLSEQYKKDFNIFSNKVVHDMKHKNYHKILKYTNINLSLIKFALPELMRHEKYAIHLINNSNYEIANCGLESKLVHYICKFSSLKVLEYAYSQSKNIDLESQDKDGWRPIHIVCKNQDIEKINFLLKKNIDINCQVKGWTPMHILSYLRMNEQVIELLELGPNLYLENNKGLKSIDIIHSNKELERIILSKGINI